MTRIFSKIWKTEERDFLVALSSLIFLSALQEYDCAFLSHFYSFWTICRMFKGFLRVINKCILFSKHVTESILEIDLLYLFQNKLKKAIKRQIKSKENKNAHKLLKLINHQ